MITKPKNTLFPEHHDKKTAGVLKIILQSGKLIIETEQAQKPATHRNLGWWQNGWKEVRRHVLLEVIKNQILMAWTLEIVTCQGSWTRPTEILKVKTFVCLFIHSVNIYQHPSIYLIVY